LEQIATIIVSAISSMIVTVSRGFIQ
jgi:hypothetical protein